jgi:hypothetical protein
VPQLKIVLAQNIMIFLLRYALLCQTGVLGAARLLLLLLLLCT